MKYGVKWIENNLGITRKALRVFEEKDLLPKNKNGQYRKYDDEGIERIWTIRLLQGMGYTLNEIRDMTKDDNFDFEYSIGEKIKQLEQKKIEIERLLGYAKAIKVTGRFPSFPKEMGNVRFDDFHEKSVNEWNVNCDPSLESLYTIADKFRERSTGQWTDTDLEQTLVLWESVDFAQQNMVALLNASLLPKAIAKRISLGAEHPKVQLLVEMIYDNLREINPELSEMTPQQFARIFSSSYIAGDIARIQEMNFGKEGCRFIADAIAIFGGYLDSNDPNLI